MIRPMMMSMTVQSRLNLGVVCLTVGVCTNDLDVQICFKPIQNVGRHEWKYIYTAMERKIDKMKNRRKKNSKSAKSNKLRQLWGQHIITLKRLAESCMNGKTVEYNTSRSEKWWAFHQKETKRMKYSCSRGRQMHTVCRCYICACVRLWLQAASLVSCHKLWSKTVLRLLNDILSELSAEQCYK